MRYSYSKRKRWKRKKELEHEETKLERYGARRERNGEIWGKMREIERKRVN